MTETATPSHRWPCGCLINDGGAHRGDGSDIGPCPDYRTVEDRDDDGRVVRWWVRREVVSRG